MNNIKRIWAALIVLCMVFALVPAATFAEGEMSGKCGEDLTWEFDSETKTLTISGTGSMYAYVRNDDSKFYSMAPWRENEAINNSLEKVIVEEGAADIGQYAF